MTREIGRPRSRIVAAAAALGADPSAGEVLVAYLHAQASELRRHDPLVRRDRPDAVHQMRVAARRMRSVLQAFGRVLDRASVADLVGELAWLGGELAQVAVAAHREGGNGFTYGLLHAADARAAERALAALPATWRRLRRRRNITWFR